MAGIIGTPISPGAPGSSDDLLNTILQNTCMAVPLWRYAQRIEYSECQFFGVRNESTIVNYQCRDIWTQEQRNNAEFYLREAQKLIEDQLGFFLCPQWVYGSVEDEPNGDFRHVDQQTYAHRLLTDWSRLIAGGIAASSSVSSGAVVAHGTDPATIGPIATTLSDVREIRVFHPNSTLEIIPTDIQISSGQLTIEIPRCRMVKESLIYNSESGLDYDDLTNFESTVDIYRIYNDPSVNAEIVSPHTCNGLCLSDGCSEYTSTGCIYIEEEKPGIIDVKYATYSGGSWSSSNNCYPGSILRLNYYSGLRYLPRNYEDAVIRLAHSLMPTEPCGCAVAKRLWERDMNVPTAITERRADNPFGLSDGAWFAWQQVTSSRDVRMSVFA